MTLIDWTPEMTAAMIGYASDLVSDFMPIIVIILGLAIAFWIITKIFNLRG